MQDEAAGREGRFESLVKGQAKFVFQVAYTVVRNVETAEDVVQETFLKLYRNRAWEGIENERAFLARAAWRIAVGRLWHSGRHGENAFAARPPIGEAEIGKHGKQRQWKVNLKTWMLCCDG